MWTQQFDIKAATKDTSPNKEGPKAGQASKFY